MSKMPSWLCLLFFFLIFDTAQATVEIYKWTPSETLLAADSVWTGWTDSGQMVRRSGCKIYQNEDVFFFLSGTVWSDGRKIDLYAAAMQAAGTRGGVIDAMAAFDRLASPQLSRMAARPQRVSSQLSLENAPAYLAVVFADRRSGALGELGYTQQKDGSFVRSARKVHQDRGGQVMFFGVHAEAYDALLKDPALRQRPFDVQRIREFFETQFSHEKARQARGEIPRSGAPVSILRIANGKAAWVEQGECPTVEP